MWKLMKYDYSGFKDKNNSSNSSIHRSSDKAFILFKKKEVR